MDWSSIVLPWLSVCCQQLFAATVPSAEFANQTLGRIYKPGLKMYLEGGMGKGPVHPLSRSDTSLLLGRVGDVGLQQLHLESSDHLLQRVPECLNKQDCSRKVCWSDWRLSLIPQEMLSGVVVISSKDSVQHQGVSLTMEGTVNLQLSAKSVGVFEAFYNSVKVRASIALGELCTHPMPC